MTEKRIEAQIIRALRTLGFAVTKTSAAVHAKGVSAGTPDLYVRTHRYGGIRVWLEVKTPKGRLSPLQQSWHVTEKEAGGHVFVVRSVGDAIAALRECGVPIS